MFRFFIFIDCIVIDVTKCLSPIQTLHSGFFEDSFSPVRERLFFLVYETRLWMIFWKQSESAVIYVDEVGATRLQLYLSQKQIDLGIFEKILRICCYIYRSIFNYDECCFENRDEKCQQFCRIPVNSFQIQKFKVHLWFPWSKSNLF